jgi:hypothetical protein
VRWEVARHVVHPHSPTSKVDRRSKWTVYFAKDVESVADPMPAIVEAINAKKAELDAKRRDLDGVTWHRSGR